MRLMMTITFPTETFNAAQRAGTVGATMQKILEATKPESIYFTEHNGLRGANVVVNVNDSSEIPALSEPWFLSFNADCKVSLAMTPEDLQRGNLDALAKQWG